MLKYKGFPGLGRRFCMRSQNFEDLLDLYAYGFHVYRST